MLPGGPPYHAIRILKEGRHLDGLQVPVSLHLCSADYQQQWQWMFVDRQVVVPLVAVGGGMLRV